MKKISTLLQIFTFGTLVLFCQNLSAQTLKDFFSSSEVPLTYLGVDFTRAKVLNEISVNAIDIRDRQYAGINNVIINEPKKYDFAKAFTKTLVLNDISQANEKNSKIDAEKIMESSADELHLKKNDIESIVKGYNFSGKKGIAVLFIMETLNKASATASMHVTLIDMGSGKILITERMSAKAAGFGFRNYWAKTVFVVLEDIRKDRYKEWKRANS